MDHLSPVLMGLRASIREDSLSSPAEMVFGAPFRLPGIIFDQGLVPDVGVGQGVDEFVESLRRNLASVLPLPVFFHSDKPGSVPKSLLSAKSVFLRVDAVRRPLEPPYEGPFQVIRRSPKTFTICRGGKNVVVSVDRLKPAFPFVPGPTSPFVPRTSSSSPSRSPGRSSPSALPPAASPPRSSATTSRSPAHSAAPGVATRSGRFSKPTVRFNI